MESAATPLVRAVGVAMGATLAELHRCNGVQLRCGVTVAGFVGDDRVTGVRLKTGEIVPADLVVVGIGATPATDWLRGSGMALNSDGGIRCDAYLRTSLPGIFAAGDVVCWPNKVMEATMRLENWSSAADQGARAAVNALFQDRIAPFETVPYFWRDWYGHRIQFVGLPGTDEMAFVSGSPGDDSFVALYRSGDRLIGAATLNEARKVMKYRRHIGMRGSWCDALALFPPRARGRTPC